MKAILRRNYMFQWEEFHQIATELLSNQQEAYIRCAASRYYYSIFGCSREYLIDILHKYEFKDGNNIHKRVYEELIDSKDLNEINLAECLNFLRVIRNHADYDKLDECPDYFKRNSEKIIKRTNEAFESLNILRKNPPYEL